MAPATPAPALLWFRRDDLRLEDHLPLIAASRSGAPLICVHVHEDNPPLPALTGAARWWEEQSLQRLERALRMQGGTLLTLRGDPARLLPELARRSGAGALYYGRHFHERERAQEATLARALQAMGVTVHGFWHSALLPPEQVTTRTGTAFKVFTPFWKSLQHHPVPRPQPCPEKLAFQPLENLPLEGAPLHSTAGKDPHWAAGMRAEWQDILAAPEDQLRDFITHDLRHYETERDRPDHEGTSRFSPLLATGLLSPRTIWHTVMQSPAPLAAKDCFLSEIAWRDFGRYTLFHQPALPEQALNGKFAAMPWRDDPQALAAWQQGRTGIPIVDAGMRELWHTGWMHNRVRMIVGSFLTKHLLTDWRAGEAWFRDTLVDADNASNAMNWQWVAGTGIDASPFFRIFNPLRQAEKFDPEGDYIRRWVPELAALPAPQLFAPWDAPPLLLRQAGIVLGRHYPAPVIDLASGRKRALEALASLKPAT